MLDAALDIREELANTYHEFHQYPELSHEEVHTSRRVANRLAELGIEVQHGIGGYGLVVSCTVKIGLRQSPCVRIWMLYPCRKRQAALLRRETRAACTLADTTRT